MPQSSSGNFRYETQKGIIRTIITHYQVEGRGGGLVPVQQARAVVSSDQQEGPVPISPTRSERGMAVYPSPCPALRRLSFCSSSLSCTASSSSCFFTSAGSSSTNFSHSIGTWNVCLPFSLLDHAVAPSLSSGSLISSLSGRCLTLLNTCEPSSYIAGFASKDMGELADVTLELG